jgi:hypothetical protein
MALITAAEAREFIPGLDGTGEDTLINAYISAADNAIARYLGFPAYDSTGSIYTCEDQTYTLYLPGRDGQEVSDDGRVLHTPRPLVSVTTIHSDSDWAYGAGDLVSSDDYLTDLERGMVILKPSSTQGEWLTSWRAQKAVVVCGFSSPPEGLKLACKQLVAHWYLLRSRHGKTSVSALNDNESLRPETWPESVIQALTPYIQRGALL